MNIELTTTPSAIDAKTISEGIVNYNHAMIPTLEPEDNEVKFSVFARDESAMVVGGLRAVCYWNTLHIELLWVSESARGAHVGSLLVNKAERFALSKDFKRALLFTTSWQAKPFYEKLGYQLEATIPDYPEGHTSYLLTKVLLE